MLACADLYLLLTVIFFMKLLFLLMTKSFFLIFLQLLCVPVCFSFDFDILISAKNVHSVCCELNYLHPSPSIMDANLGN